MRFLLIESEDPSSWIEALAHLTIFRKRMQGSQLSTVMSHVDTEDEDSTSQMTPGWRRTCSPSSIRTSAEHTIGYLLASANIAKYTLSPEDPDTRRLKELIMPACEVYFRPGALPDVSLMLQQMRTHFTPVEPPSEDDDDEGGIFFERGVDDDEAEVDSVWGHSGDWEKSSSGRDARKAFANIVVPLKALSLTDIDLVPQVRQLTFIAPIVKLLLLRELLLDPSRLM